MAQMWDLRALRRELADRGLDLPADVLRSTEDDHFEEHLEVQLNGGDLLFGSTD